MYLRTHEREKRTKVEAINPPARAELFRKAKDDKGRSGELPVESRRTGGARSYVYSSRVLAGTIMFKNNDRELA